MPRLIDPAPGASVPYRVTFRWTVVAGAAAYEIQVGRDQKFSQPLVLDEKPAGTPYPAEIRVLDPLWWRVRAMDARGGTSAWSPVHRFEIKAPPLATAVLGVTLTPSRVVGGEYCAGLITLEQAAPSGGATVALSASGPARVAVPSGVLFAEGELEAPFAVATRPVTEDATAHILASARAGGRTTTLFIGPPRPPASLSSLAVRPAIIAAGRDAQGTVTLTSLASSNVTVRLASSDASRIVVPAQIKIPPGAAASNFVVETAHLTTSGKVTITASLEGTSRSATVDINPAAASDPLPAPLLRPQSLSAPNEFSWSDVMGAASYTIEIADSGDFSGALAASRTVPATRITITPLPGRTLWWHVCANDASGSPGRWSEPRMVGR